MKRECPNKQREMKERNRKRNKKKKTEKKKKEWWVDPIGSNYPSTTYASYALRQGQA